MPLVSNVSALCRMVKIEHSIFALPFAYLGAFAAAQGWPGWYLLLVLTVAMVCIRSFAMTFNRIVDLNYDRQNPRTANRPLVTGEITMPQAWSFCGVMALGFVFSTAALNQLCLLLSPVALAIASVYSLTKRFTWLCHFVLGAVLGLAPIAGWLAVTAQFSLPPVLFGLAVLFWTAGFDILYACQDMDFDRAHGLHSAPARYGILAALTVSSFCHANTVIFLLLAGWGCGLAWPWYAVIAAVALLLYWEHQLVKPDDLSRLNLAFFAINGAVSLVLFLGLLLALYSGAFFQWLNLGKAV